MSNLYKNIISLCDLKGISGYKLCKEINMSPGILTDLKNGRKQTVTAETAKRIADYFGVSVECVIFDQNEKTTVNDDGLTDKQRELIEMIKNMSDEELAKKLPVMKQILDI